MRFVVGRWRQFRAVDLGYAACGEHAEVSAYRGRWRRPVSIAASRQDWIDLAEAILDGERDTITASDAARGNGVGE